MSASHMPRASDVVVGVNKIWIPGFVIHSHLGEGANADVYLASDNILGREVAIKVWRRKSSEASDRALEETRKLAAIRHPNFAQIYQFSKVGEFPYAVMEFIDGTTLKTWLARKTEHNSRPTIWAQFSSAMKHLYGTGILHGDPHTGNIMLSSPPIGYTVPSVAGSYVPRPSTTQRVSILDTGTSRFWRRRSDFEWREKAVMIETVDRLFGRHCLSETAVVPADATLEEILMIGDLLAVVFAAACAGPPQGSENMFDQQEEMEYVASRLPSYIKHAVALTYLREGQPIAQTPKLKFQRRR